MQTRKTIDCFVENLTHYSQEKGLSITEIAKLLGVSQSTVSMWRTGKAFPRIEVLEKLAAYFEISVSELLIDSKAVSGNENHTLAKHFNGEDYTPEELDEITKYANYVRSQRLSSNPQHNAKDTDHK